VRAALTGLVQSAASSRSRFPPPSPASQLIIAASRRSQLSDGLGAPDWKTAIRSR
jgi:hypothetical protein